MEINDFLEMINGTEVNESDEELSKVITSIKLSLMSPTTKEEKIINEQSVWNPVMQIRNMLEYVMVDIEFESEIDADLKSFWKAVEDYLNAMNEYGSNENEDANVPLLTVLAMPEKYNGQYYAIATNPIFSCLTPLKPEKPASCLRLLFNAEQVQFYETPEMDLSDIDSEAEIREMEESYLHERNALKKEQRMEQMEEAERARKNQI